MNGPPSLAQNLGAMLTGREDTNTIHSKQSDVIERVRQSVGPSFEGPHQQTIMEHMLEPRLEDIYLDDVRFCSDCSSPA